MSVKVLVAGDLCAAGRPAAVLSSNDPAPEWTDLSTITATTDFALANLECPLTDSPEPILKSGPCLWAPTKCATAIRAAGFTAVSLANNHIMDAGPRGLTDTLRACDQAGLMHVGAGESTVSASAPLSLQLNGLALAILAFAENEFSTTVGNGPSAWALDPTENCAQIAAARRDHDCVLVVLHGGVEGYPLPSPQLRKTCRSFIDHGADAVICHHSHVVGANESHHGRPIAYGLGNLLFDPFGPAADDWFVGCFALLEFERQKPAELQLVPYRQDPFRAHVALLAGHEHDALMSHLTDLGSTLRDPERFETSWKALCAQRRTWLLESILCLTKPEAWLLSKGLLPTKRLRLTPRRLARLYDLFSCESLHETCTQMLRDLLEETEGRRKRSP